MSTYTVAFDDSSFDESDSARKVALRYNTNHTTLNAHIKPQEDILKVVDSYDEPFADPSAIPSMAVCKAASKELKVVLSGDGGDEIFGGYRRAMAAKLATDLNKYGVKIPNFLIKPLNFLTQSEDKYRSNLSFLNRFLSGLDKDPVNRYMIWAANGVGHQKYSTFNQEFTLAYNNSLLSFVDESQDVFQQLTCMDFSSQLPDALLVKMDIASMAHGLEVRSPFLDKDLTEFGLSIPMNVKLKNYKTKSLLRSLASRYLPSKIFNSPKQGFEIPLVTWLQKDLVSLVQDSFSNRNSIVYDIFDKKYIESLPENSQNLNLHQWANQLWIILMFRLWEERVHKT